MDELGRGEHEAGALIPHDGLQLVDVELGVEHSARGVHHVRQAVQDLRVEVAVLRQHTDRDHWSVKGSTD